MKLGRRRIQVNDLTEEQTDLRFELFDWLKSKGLSVRESVALLDLTSKEIERAARNQLI